MKDTRLVTFGEKIKALEKDKTLMLQELEATRGAVRVLYGMNQNQYDARILALERQKIMSEIRMKRGARAGEDMEAQVRYEFAGRQKDAECLF